MEWIASPNYSKGRNGKNIDFIVIHWFGIGGIEGAISSFQNPSRQASAHYLVSNSRIVKMVDEADTAWHAGVLDINQRSIGIEHDANLDRDLSEESYQTAGKLIREIADRHGIPLDREHIKGHNEFKATQCPGTINIDKLIEIAKGGSMDIAKALSCARSFNPDQNEINYINGFISSRPAEDYARENLFKDAWVNNLWIATMGVSAPQTEKDFWQRYGVEHPDQNIPEVLANTWYSDHVKPLKAEATYLSKELSTTRQTLEKNRVTYEENLEELESLNAQKIQNITSDKELLALEVGNLTTQVEELKLQVAEKCKTTVEKVVFESLIWNLIKSLFGRKG